MLSTDASTGRVLVVEDDAEIADVLRRSLRQEGHEVRTAADGVEALDATEEFIPDLVVLDLGLPRLDGVEVCRRIRSESDVPILILTARSGTEDRVEGLDSGADDYLVKPFAFAELIARLEALHRRGTGQLELFRAGPVSVDGRRRVIVGPEGELGLTPREYALACELFSHVGEVVARSHLLSAVWGSSFEGDPNVLDVYIGYLRGKLTRVAGERVRIKAVRGVGLRLLVGPGGE
jgi:two-component system OmpR family response regulator